MIEKFQLKGYIRTRFGYTTKLGRYANSSLDITKLGDMLSDEVKEYGKLG